MSNLRVGWIGTGVMGAPMAGHLLDAGHPVAVFNRTKAKAEPLLARGAKWAVSPAEAAQQSDIVFAIVGFPDDVRSVFLGENGIVPVLKPGQICVDMATSPPALAEEIAAAASARQAAFLDAPVSGGQIGAQSAKLTIFTGGEKAAYETALPLLQKMGRTITHLGHAGAGQHAKMANQILIAGQMLAIAEALSYARNCGLQPLAAVEAIAGGAAASWSLSNLAPRILKEDFAPGFYVDHFVKDLGIALAEARRMKLPLPLLAQAEQFYIALQAQGHGRLGTQAIIKVYEAMRG